jgi:hypothetical protein
MAELLQEEEVHREYVARGECRCRIHIHDAD